MAICWHGTHDERRIGFDRRTVETHPTEIEIERRTHNRRYSDQGSNHGVGMDLRTLTEYGTYPGYIEVNP